MIRVGCRLEEDLLKKLYDLKIDLHKEVFEQLLCLCVEYQPTNKFQMGLYKSLSSIFRVMGQATYLLNLNSIR